MLDIAWSCDILGVAVFLRALCAGQRGRRAQ